MGLAWPFNLGALGNSIAIWLGINPWQLFFYVFLPPLLLDAAVRIDWYLFKKVWTVACTVLIASCQSCVAAACFFRLLGVLRPTVGRASASASARPSASASASA
jgi:NhaP-type Na+/H+ or K+/H+ antiporter